MNSQEMPRAPNVETFIGIPRVLNVSSTGLSTGHHLIVLFALAISFFVERVSDRIRQLGYSALAFCGCYSNFGSRDYIYWLEVFRVR